MPTNIWLVLVLFCSRDFAPQNPHTCWFWGGLTKRHPTPEAIIVGLSWSIHFRGPIWTSEFHRLNRFNPQRYPQRYPQWAWYPCGEFFRREEIEVAHQQCFRYRLGKFCLEQARKQNDQSCSYLAEMATWTNKNVLRCSFKFATGQTYYTAVINDLLVNNQPRTHVMNKSSHRIASSASSPTL